MNGRSAVQDSVWRVKELWRVCLQCGHTTASVCAAESSCVVACGAWVGLGLGSICVNVSALLAMVPATGKVPSISGASMGRERFGVNFGSLASILSLGSMPSSTEDSAGGEGGGALQNRHSAQVRFLSTAGVVSHFEVLWLPS